jgi:hypothetical protein
MVSEMEALRSECKELRRLAAEAKEINVMQQ